MKRLMSLCGMIVLTLGSCLVTREEARKVEELKQLAKETPVYPDFEQVDRTEITKSETAVLAYFYRSSASYEQVKNFYNHALAERGWGSPVEEVQTRWFSSDASRRITFKKGKYFIDVEYSASEDSGWRFAVDYGWRKQ